MATKKDDQAAAEVTQPASESPGGVDGAGSDQQAVKGAKLANEDKALRGGRTDGAILTSEPKREADKTSYPVPNDAKPEDPPVRTTRPDVPIVASLATGAGEHQPPDPSDYHPDGRPRHDGNP